jgi:hypothetical protein
MADETYTLIQKTTVTSAGASSISFTNIPPTFTDLVVMCSLRNETNGTAQSGWVKFNGSSTGYAHKYLGGDGASAGSAGDASATRIYIGQVDGATATANTFANVSIYIPNYTSANYKSVSIDGVQETNDTTAYATLSAGLWSNTDAITSISLETTAGNYVQYSSASLYGVAKFGVTAVAGPRATGGDIITNDGTYWIHQFLNSGTFTPNETLSTDYLVVAGGGGAGTNRGGGGGAGGYRTASGFSATARTSYTVSIGAGGIGGHYNGSAYYGAYDVIQTAGSNSVFHNTTSSGGGRGGQPSTAASAGGSGGGGHNDSTSGAAGNTGSFSPVEGFAGGNAIANSGGGGGGSSAVGTTGVGSSHPQSNAGAGTANSITGSSVTYAVGGHGGGTGPDINGADGTINRGNGGSGASSLAGSTRIKGGAGGSGIVIIRYAM